MCYKLSITGILIQASRDRGSLAPSLVVGVHTLGLNDLLFREQIAIMRRDGALEPAERDEQDRLVRAFGPRIKASGYPHRAYRGPVSLSTIHRSLRSDERRLGKECVSTSRF